MGVPGDRVKVEGGKVYLNGNLLDEKFLPDDFVTEAGEFCQEGEEVSIPEGMYLPFGDNRSHSRDGREFGPIKKDLIVGRAFLKYWPVSAVGLIPTIRF